MPYIIVIVDELADLMQALDIVFSVNTSVMTLAGAIGVKTLSPGGIGTLGKEFNIISCGPTTVAMTNLSEDIANISGYLWEMDIIVKTHVMTQSFNAKMN